MIDVTVEQIRAAAASDLSAITEVLAALEPRIAQHANKRATNGGIRNHDLAEELQQEGRIAVWQCMERFKGDSVAQFFSYVDRTLSGVMDDVRRAETRQGVSEDTAYRFEQCLTACAGDPYDAEREAVRPDGVLGTQRMTPETAYAARLSWQGVARLDAPIKATGGQTGAPSHEAQTLADRLAWEGHLSVSSDLAEADDVARARRKAIREAVHATLARMGTQQAFVLRATYGIDPVPPMDSDREIADALAIPETRVTVVRWKGKERFRTLYLRGAHTNQTAA